jgi:CRISPR system Cascade subunit CasC
MTEFLQLHFLSVYPPSNPNRDDTGRPKTALFGNATRLRLSSQALKRAWRTSDFFKKCLDGKVGERTQRIGKVVYDHLDAKGVDAQRALEIARLVGDVFGKLVKESSKEPTYIEQLAFISPEERMEALRIADRVLNGEQLTIEKEEADDDGEGRGKKKKVKKLPAEHILRTADTAVDIAMFGRMLADDRTTIARPQCRWRTPSLPTRCWSRTTTTRLWTI